MDKLQKSVSEKLTCYHCGEHAEESSKILHDSYIFCCEGCKSVYQIINDANLCDFYQLDEKVNTASRTTDQNRYKALDLEEVAKELIEFSHEGLAKVTLFSPSIHCSSCIWLLEHLPKINRGIVKSTVNFVKKEVTIMFYTDSLSLKDVAMLLDAIGYPPVIEKKKGIKKHNSDLVIRLAVAGFFFGNSMLISIPEYLDFNYQLPSIFLDLFGYLNLIFALPVFFYSAQVYFKSAWKGLKHKFINIDVPISIGIFTLFVRSLMDILIFEGTGYVDSLNGLVFFLLIGRWYQHKTYQALSFDRDVSSFFPIAVSKLLDGEEVTAKLEDLEVGDEIVLHNQELIPAEAILVSGSANIDYSFVTGESLPVVKQVNETLFAGGRQMGTPITIQLTKRVNNSHLTKLWNESGNKDDESSINNITDRISKYFTIIILLLAIAGGGLWLLIDPSKSINVFTSILIVACPCALALAVPFTYGHTMRLFGKMGFYLKKADVIEKVASTKKIVFDKTGTLSKPLPEQVEYIGTNLSADENSLVYSACLSSIHPLSKLISAHLKGYDQYKLVAFEEIPGKGIVASYKEHEIRIGSAEWLGQSKLENTAVWVEINEVVKGRFEFAQSYRSGVFEQLNKLKKTHELHMLSGDNQAEKSRLATSQCNNFEL